VELLLPVESQQPASEEWVALVAPCDLPVAVVVARISIRVSVQVRTAAVVLDLAPLAVMVATACDLEVPFPFLLILVHVVLWVISPISQHLVLHTQTS
jgi:hypothetical protein